MKIAVVGAGIIGITTAYELTQRSHEVTVFEKSASVAEVGSFATGSTLAGSLTQPFSHATWPKSGSLATMISNASLLSAKELLKMPTWRWLAAWSRASGAGQFQRQFSGNATLLSQSIERIAEICRDEKIEFEQSSGQLLLLPNAVGPTTLDAKFAVLKELGIAQRTLSEHEISGIEPSLRQANGIQRAHYFPGDLVGNCRQFAQLLKDCASDAGARFEFNSDLTSIQCTPGVTLRLQGSNSGQPFDAVVLCTGAAAVDRLVPLKTNIALMPAHAYALSASMREPVNGPRSAVFDVRTQVSITKVGNRIRASGGARLGMPNARSAKTAQDLLYRAVQSHFPGAASLSTNSAQFWSAGTLVAADALPLIGATAVPGVYVNIGHGFNGWGMACGAAQVLADSMGQTAAGRSESPFSPERFAR